MLYLGTFTTLNCGCKCWADDDEDLHGNSPSLVLSMTKIAGKAAGGAGKVRTFHENVHTSNTDR